MRLTLSIQHRYLLNEHQPYEVTRRVLRHGRLIHGPFRRYFATEEQAINEAAGWIENFERDLARGRPGGRGSSNTPSSATTDTPHPQRKRRRPS